MQGFSVALSGDGNTAIVGGPGDNVQLGAAWVYTRSGGVWTQQGSKLVGTGAVGSAHQGISVALSADGNTAIVGGTTDNAGIRGRRGSLSSRGTLQVSPATNIAASGIQGQAILAHVVRLSAEFHDRQRSLFDLRDSELAQRLLHLGHGHHPPVTVTFS